MRYWGIHNGIREEEARPEQRRNRVYPHIPYDERMSVGDVACLFDINRCLYGWGIITAIGPIFDTASGPRRNVTVNQSFLQYQLKSVSEIRQLERFSNWDRITNENLSWFSDEQSQYLRSVFPLHNQPPDPTATREEMARIRAPRPVETDFIEGRKLQYTESRFDEFKTVRTSNVLRAILNEIDEYVIAFLNLEDRRYEDYCRIFWGIEDTSGRTVGIRLSNAQRDEVCTTINGKIRGIKPPVAASACFVEIHDVKDTNGSLIDGLVVLEVGVGHAAEGEFYCSQNNSFYIRQDRNNVRLEGQALVAELRRRFRR
jgi:hypothetical protein